MRNLNRIHLNSLRAVEAAGRLGSLRAAADELGVTIGAVSQQVNKTESQLGHRLFNRVPKGVQPNALGQEVVRHLAAGMRELSAAITLAEGRSGDVLTVSAAPVFAGKWLVWRLKRFHARHPQIRIRIDATVALADPNVSDVDVGIRVGRGGWAGVQAEKLLVQRVFPVCAPAIAQRIKSPEHLARVPIIRDAESMFGWDTWLRADGLETTILGEGPVFSDASLCLDAAVAGQGVFLAWETLANDAVAAGRLVAPFPDRRVTDLSYWFITAQSATMTPRVRAFREWLREELRTAIPGA